MPSEGWDKCDSVGGLWMRWLHMETGTGRMLWSSAPHAPACFSISLLCPKVVEWHGSVVPVWLSLCH